MNTVLIVDDDESFLLSLAEGFKAYEDQFGIIPANNGIEAVAVLNEHEINLVLTDLKMPRMDGFELVAHLSAHHPEIPVIVMTAFGTPEMEDSLKEMGAFQYIEKPIDFNLLVKKILAGLEGSSKGFISGVSLTSFLQLLELDGKTCTLGIRSGALRGTMFFRDGQLLDASTGTLSGKEAAFEIVSWKNVSIEIDSACTAREKKISESLGFILLEGSRRKDEREAAAQSQPRRQSTALEDINVDGIDLDLSVAEELLPKGSPSPQPPPPGRAAESARPQSAQPASPLDQFIQKLKSMRDIVGSLVIAKDGAILHQATPNGSQTANFITYVAVATDQIRMAIGSTGKQYTLFTLAGGEKLLVLCGEAVIIGLEIGRSAPHEPIVDSLRPLINRIIP